MQRAFLIAIVLVMCLAPAAVAGRRCNRCGQSYSSSRGWGTSCYACHKQKAAAQPYGWREALVTIEKQKIETAAFIQGLKTVAGNGELTIQGSPYSSVSGEFSSYPVGQGNTLFGVQSYGVSPAIDRMAILNMQTKLQASVQASAHQGAQDTVDLLNVSHAQATEESKLGLLLQANQAAFMAAQPQPVQQTFRFSATTQPNGQVVIQPEAVQQPAANPGLAVLEARCASCHDGPAAPGKFSLAGELSKELAVEIERRIKLPVDDPQFMPRVKSGDGFGAGLPLDDRERHAVETLLWSVQ